MIKNTIPQAMGDSAFIVNKSLKKHLLLIDG